MSVSYRKRVLCAFSYSKMHLVTIVLPLRYGIPITELGQTAQTTGTNFIPSATYVPVIIQLKYVLEQQKKWIEKDGDLADCRTTTMTTAMTMTTATAPADAPAMRAIFGVPGPSGLDVGETVGTAADTDATPTPSPYRHDQTTQSTIKWRLWHSCKVQTLWALFLAWILWTLTKII